MGKIDPLCSSADSGGERYFVMKHNAPVHNSLTTNRLRDQMGIIRLNHPPFSPGLNLIGNCGWFTNDEIAKLLSRPTILESL